MLCGICNQTVPEADAEAHNYAHLDALLSTVEAVMPAAPRRPPSIPADQQRVMAPVGGPEPTIIQATATDDAPPRIPVRASPVKP